MDILELIKQRKTIRKYADKPVPREVIDKIIEAGVWGPSIPSFLRIQPWQFVVSSDRKKIEETARIILEKSKKIGAGANILLSAASRIIAGAPVLIFVYNSQDLQKVESKFKELYSNFKEIIPRAELSAISAAIQNMLLVAEKEGVGSCWLDTPLFCKEEIAELTGNKNDLIAVLTFGYPVEEGRRSPRKPLSEMVKYI